MGWRDFQVTAPMEFMENMELIPPEPSLIPLIPLIPPMGLLEKKAWLVNGELRTSGYIDDISREIVTLTADNLPEQKRLLLLHVETYDRHHFPALAELWQERSAIMQYDGGLSKEQAEDKAAELLNCIAFLPELRLNA